MVAHNQALSPNAEAVVAEVIDGEAVLIDLTTGVYYSLAGVGGSIWSLIEAGSSVDGIVEAIAGRYEASREQVEADVAGLVGELERQKLIVVAEGGPAGLRDPQAPPDGKLPYDTPELKTYRDMGDLLALDPPLPGIREIPWTAPTEKPLD
jgi:Coenzyme PQQ synthesis protein D (PqqD)